MRHNGIWGACGAIMPCRARPPATMRRPAPGICRPRARAIGCTARRAAAAAARERPGRRAGIRRAQRVERGRGPCRWVAAGSGGGGGGLVQGQGQGIAQACGFGANFFSNKQQPPYSLRPSPHAAVDAWLAGPLGASATPSDLAMLGAAVRLPLVAGPLLVAAVATMPSAVFASWPLELMSRYHRRARKHNRGFQDGACLQSPSTPRALRPVALSPMRRASRSVPPQRRAR